LGVQHGQIPENRSIQDINITDTDQKLEKLVFKYQT